ncbi:MAG: hypothetical protein CMN30_21130 [Sandaracinus sp.]|nr:hypothetical protein [Sandaracinus sp.]
MHFRRLACVLALLGCGGTATSVETETTPTATVAEAPPAAPRTYDDLERLRFNQVALRLNLPLFWAGDPDGDGAIDPAEVRTLDFYTDEEVSWVDADGQFTPGFDEAYDLVVAAAAESAPSDARAAAIREELESTAPTLIETDLSAMPAAHREFARHMRAVAGHIDALYAQQVGATALSARVDAADPAASSLFRRNWGTQCRGATTESVEACSAIAGGPSQPVDVYPAAIQGEDGFCATLEARDDSAALLDPFTVVREGGESGLRAVPYNEAYAAQITPLVAELRTAADAVSADPAETELVAYLRAAADSFESNDWDPANEAWAAMNAENSKWYVRVAPDEVYWDPCSRKAGFHLTLALIDPASLAWQEKLTPLQEEMEGALARLVRRYRARDVSFHMPDFIRIVINAGDDRDPFGATIGQSLPNWGPVAEEGRGRTVAMSNLYADPDSQARRRTVASTLVGAEMMAQLGDGTDAGLMSTILHEATHNLGPTSATKIRGKVPGEVFGGGLASMLEELKAQTGALYYVPMLVEKDVISADEARETYLDSIVWAFGHISRGMTTPDGQRKPYSQLAAVQVGWLMTEGVLAWDAEATAADGETQGAFTVDLSKMEDAVKKLMTEVVRIKATGDRAAAEALADRFVPDDSVVPHEEIRQRYQRFPRTTFVYDVHF